MKNSRKYIYGLTLLLITLSGFAQMPIFKRYYIADIPGFAWLAQFYVTHLIHYITAVVFIAFVFYILTDFLVQRSSFPRVSLSGKMKIFFIAGLIITGGLMAYKNLPGVFMDQVLISILDLIHLGLCMMLLGTSLYSIIRKKSWFKT